MVGHAVRCSGVNYDSVGVHKRLTGAETKSAPPAVLSATAQELAVPREPIAGPSVGLKCGSRQSLQCFAHSRLHTRRHRRIGRGRAMPLVILPH
jgi:hypothetical protein